MLNKKSSHLVKDQALAKTGQQLCYLVSFKLWALIYISFRVHWIYLSAASFLGRIGARDIFQSGSGSGVFYIHHLQPRLEFWNWLSNEEHKERQTAASLIRDGIDL